MGVELPLGPATEGTRDVGQPVTVTLELAAGPTADRTALPTEDAVGVLEELARRPPEGQRHLELGPPEVGHHPGELLSALGRGDERAVGDLVRDGEVAGVADAGPDGHLRGGDGPRDLLVVEGSEVGFRTPAADDDDEVALPRLEALDRRGDRSGCLSPLDLGPRGAHVEGHARALELPQEVAPALGRGTGREPDPERHRRHRKSLVAFEEPLVDERLDQPGPGGGHLAEQGVGVEIGKDEADVAARLVELHLAAHPDHQPGVERDPEVVERGAHDAPAARPADGLQNRGAGVVGGGRVDELEVAVTARAHVERTDLARDPHLAGHRVGDGTVESAVQLTDGERVGAVPDRCKALAPGSDDHRARLEPGWVHDGFRQGDVASVGRWGPTVSRLGGRGVHRSGGDSRADGVEEGRDSTGQGAG